LPPNPTNSSFCRNGGALLIIDMQRDFLEPGGFGAALGNDVSMLRRAIEPTRRVLFAARPAGMTVVHTREGHRADLFPARFVRGRLGRLATRYGKACRKTASPCSS
jgi:nicotinamidase-related amidase